MHFSRIKTRHTLVSAQGTLFHSVPWGKILIQIIKIVPLYFYDNIDDTFQIILLNQFWRIWHKLHYTGRGLGTVKRVVIGSDRIILLRVQIVWKGRRQFYRFVAEILPHFIKWLGSSLSTIQADVGSRLQILNAAFWPSNLKGSVLGKEVETLNHNNTLWGNRLFSLFYRWKKAAWDCIQTEKLERWEESI